MNVNDDNDVLLSMIREVAPEVRLEAACRDEEIYSDDPADHALFDERRVTRILRAAGISLQETEQDLTQLEPVYRRPWRNKVVAFGGKVGVASVAAALLVAIGLASVSYQAIQSAKHR